MPQRLSRRRFATVTRYLNELIADPKQPHRLRLRAAERLLELHERYDRANERDARRTKPEGNTTPEHERPQGEPVEAQGEASEGDHEAAVRAAFDVAMQRRPDAV